MSLIKQRSLAELYALADQCSPDYPATLVKKLELLAEVQIILGRRAADAVRDYKKHYAARKTAYNEAYLAADKHREQHAELAVSEMRMIEADLEADKVRWQNAYESNSELINTLKYSLKVLLDEYNNPANGRGS